MSMDWPTDRTIVVADWWYCGDICGCSYPRIRRLDPPVTEHTFKDDETGHVSKSWSWDGPKSGKLEEGPWSADYERTEEQWEWLLEAARRHHVFNLAEIEQEAKEWLHE